MNEGTSLADMVGVLAPHKQKILMGLAGLPILGPLVGKILVNVRERVGAWFLSGVVHLAVFLTVPSLLIIAYLMLATDANLLTDVDALLTFGPVVSGVLTLFLVPQVMALDRIPGFSRIASLAMLVAISSVMAYILAKTRIFAGIFMIATFKDLLMMGVVIYLIMAVLWSKVTGPASDHDFD